MLAIVFESNHCPVSQLYEGRIEKLYEDYRSKGVTLVAINPNNPKTVRLDELGYTDVTDSLPEMKLRAQLRGIDWPYLYDGDTQAISMKFGAVATPHIFIFDQQRKLRYQGRIDDNQREELVKTQDARNALDALLAGKPGAGRRDDARSAAPRSGCRRRPAWSRSGRGSRRSRSPSTWSAPTTSRSCARTPPTRSCSSTSGRPAARACTEPVLRSRDHLPHVPQARLRPGHDQHQRARRSAAVLDFLKKQYASSPNKQFASADRAALQAAWGEKWNPAAPLTMVIAPGGKVLYQKEGKIDILEVRRIILAAMPDTSGYIGSKAYWMNAIAETKTK